LLLAYVVLLGLLMKMLFFWV